MKIFAIFTAADSDEPLVRTLADGTKGRKFASQKSRANRRKAARR